MENTNKLLMVNEVNEHLKFVHSSDTDKPYVEIFVRSVPYEMSEEDVESLVSFFNAISVANS